MRRNAESSRRCPRAVRGAGLTRVTGNGPQPGSHVTLCRCLPLAACGSSSQRLDLECFGGRETMSETDKVFPGSIPENDVRYRVPLIFESFAQDLAQRIAALSPNTVLETAAGSGVVTRALTARL